MSRQPSLLVAALAAAPALAAPSYARADGPTEEGAWTLAVAGRNTFVGDGAFDLYSADDVLRGFDLSVARRVWDGLSASVAWLAGGASEGAVLSAYEFEYNHHAVAAALLYESVELSRALVGGDWLRPIARVEGGLVFGRAAVLYPNDPSGEAVSQWTMAPRAHGAVGLRLVPISNARVPTQEDREQGRTPSGYTFAVDVELGWTLLTRLTFDNLTRSDDESGVETPGASVPPDPDDEDRRPIRRHPLDLGTLILEGAELRIGAMMRF